MLFPLTFLLMPLQVYTALVTWRRNLAVPLKCKDGFSWRHWCWEAIPLDSDINAVPEPEKRRLTGYQHSINQLQASPTPPLPCKNVRHACCTLLSIPSLRTVWCGNQCSALSVCCACWCATLRHLHNANANRALVCCTHITVHRKMWVWSWITTMGLYSHVAQCILHFANVRCVDFHTVYDQIPFGPSAGRDLVATAGILKRW